MDLRDKAKMLAFVLWGEFNAKQTNIAKVLKVSEGTISLWLKEMRYKKDISLFTRELEDIRAIAKGLENEGLLDHRHSFDVLHKKVNSP